MAVFILCFVASLAVLSFFTTRHYHNTLLGQLKLCESEYKNGDKKTAAKTAAEFYDYWEKSHYYLAAFINRETIDEIEKSVARLSSYVKTQNDDMFFAEYTLTKMLLEDMFERERLTLLTIF